ncbi:hypothetical protein BCV70DRAFT_217865 [Testicularia cyperi]|uniref:Uncharacterized protein n=1 Tax=Testicularia cyperi TaxID=1882483 RepID=A0A317XMI4_9BASI|nr:hypothetical protein BCV70DRAFT_217865 [Testicularia cyperi]
MRFNFFQLVVGVSLLVAVARAGWADEVAKASAEVRASIKWLQDGGYVSSEGELIHTTGLSSGEGERHLTRYTNFVTSRKPGTSYKK